jgi:peptide chain release factor 1
LIDQRPGLAVIAFTGPGVKQLFQGESGGHRWQRIPPTEKRGRVQTSTVTVAVFDPDAVTGNPLTYQDVDIATARGSGPGGQNRNKTESCVIVTHKATGLQVRIDNERSQSQNKAMAMKVLAARLYDAERERTKSAKDDQRKQQVGTGQRGDKVRTYRTQDDQITDHRTGQKTRLSKWYNGDWE